MRPTYVHEYGSLQEEVLFTVWPGWCRSNRPVGSRQHWGSPSNLILGASKEGFEYASGLPAETKSAGAHNGSHRTCGCIQSSEIAPV